MIYIGHIYRANPDGCHCRSTPPRVLTALLALTNPQLDFRGHSEVGKDGEEGKREKEWK